MLSLLRKTAAKALSENQLQLVWLAGQPKWVRKPAFMQCCNTAVPLNVPP